jgi:hypothetical protein
MNKLTQPVPERRGLSASKLSEAELEAWFERNRDALKESLDVARRQLGEGRSDNRTIAEIIAEGTRRHLAKQ